MPTPTGEGGTLNVASSNIMNNTATSKGGGISTIDGIVTITNSNINSNQVNSTGTALGGGIYALDSTLDVENSNVNGNQANGTVLGQGGGIYFFSTDVSKKLKLVFTNVKGNKASTSDPDIFIGP
jgi:predicted outer membrane repeat protein